MSYSPSLGESMGDKLDAVIKQLVALTEVVAALLAETQAQGKKGK